MPLSQKTHTSLKGGFFFLMHIYRFPAFEISSEVDEKTLGKMRFFWQDEPANGVVKFC